MPELKNVLFEEPGQRKLVARSFIKPESVKPEKRHHRRHRFVKQLRFSDFSPMEFMDDTAALPLDQMAQIIGDEYNSPRWETLRARAGKLPANVDFYLFRHESGVTKKDLGELVGVSQALISEYEVRRAVSDPTTAKRIADVFCREVEEVFPDADISLEVPMSSVGLVPEQIVHDKQQDSFDEVCEYHLRVDVDDVLRSLTHRERRVIQLRFGLDDDRERSLNETGEMFGVSGVRIRQIELKALRKLRHPSRSKKLADYFDVSGEAKNLLLGKLPWLVSARVREILADPNYQSADYEKEYPERVNLWIRERDYTDSVKKALADLRKLK